MTYYHNKGHKKSQVLNSGPNYTYMSHTIRISQENKDFLKSIHKVPNRALNQLRTGNSIPLKDRESELEDLTKRVVALEELASKTY